MGRRFLYSAVLLTAQLLGSCTPSYAAQKAATVSFEKLADAIYLAEGGSKTRHPYGILAHYKHTTPRQACLNTIKHKFRDWQSAGNPGSFLNYLQSRYAPLAASNDPRGLNRNWLSNVTRFYKEGV